MTRWLVHLEIDMFVVDVVNSGVRDQNENKDTKCYIDSACKRGNNAEHS